MKKTGDGPWGREVTASSPGRATSPVILATTTPHTLPFQTWTTSEERVTIHHQLVVNLDRVMVWRRR